MQTRHKEHDAIPGGFENFSLQEIDDSISYENLLDKDKELVLISTPVDFSINELSGEQFILGGSRLLNTSQSSNEESVIRWELHSSVASSDNHLNILLPSQLQKKHLLSNYMLGMLDVVRSVSIPDLEYCSKKEKGTCLPKPVGLKARWVPYGSEYPAENHKKLSEYCNEEMHMMPIDDNNKNHVEVLSIKSENEESALNCHEKRLKKKKKKKKLNSHKSCQEELHISIAVESNIQSVGVKMEADEDSMADIPRKHNKKKKKSNLQKSGQEDLNQNLVENEQLINKHDVKVESDESVVNISNKKHKRKKNKSSSNESFQNNLNENTITNESIIQQSDIKLDDERPQLDTVKKKHKKKKKSDSQENDHKNISEDVKDNGQQQLNIKLENDEDALVNITKKHKKKKSSLPEANHESISQIIVNNDNNIHQLNIKTENVHDSYTSVLKTHKKKKKKSNSQETEGHVQSSQITELQEMMPKQNSIQLKSEYENSSVENHSDSKRHKKKKRKSKIRDLNVDSCNIKPETTSNVDVLRTYEMSDTLSEKKRTKKRKNKSISSGEVIFKKQKSDSFNEDPKKNMHEGSNKEVSSLDFDSDLDSDTEAKIFGVIPKKIGFSNQILAT